MKIKLTILALCTCSISFLSAQTATPDKPAAEKPAAEKPAAEKPAAKEEVKPEGPLEERAFEIFNLTSTLPDIFASVKDDASVAAAKLKLDAMSTKLKAHAAELKKMDVPSNEARKKLKAKIDPKQKMMEKKMQGAMQGLMQLDEETAMKAGAMFMTFGQTMQELSPVMQKYFTPDTEAGEKDE